MHENLLAYHCGIRLQCMLPAWDGMTCWQLADMHVLCQQADGSSQQGSHHGSDLALAEVAEYLASDNKLPSAGSLGSTSAEPHIFRPGWEDIFRMNQKQLEVCFLS